MLRIKGEWQLQEAKAKLSNAIDRAIAGGPQRITRHGRPAAVLVSEDDFVRLTGRKAQPLAAFLAGSELGDLEL